MSTLIELEEPFKSVWSKGYLQRHPNGRRYICLFNSNKNRSLISYARYLLGLKQGFIPSSNIEADHVDNDFTNDDPDNIQPLTAVENKRKQHLSDKGYIFKELPQTCAICKCIFYKHRPFKTCGSDKCSEELRVIIRSYLPVTEEIKLDISNRIKEGQTYDEIKVALNVSHSTIAKYKDYNSEGDETVSDIELKSSSENEEISKSVEESQVDTSIDVKEDLLNELNELF